MYCLLPVVFFSKHARSFLPLAASSKRRLYAAAAAPGGGMCDGGIIVEEGDYANRKSALVGSSRRDPAVVRIHLLAADVAIDADDGVYRPSVEARHGVRAVDAR